MFHRNVACKLSGLIDPPSQDLKRVPDGAHVEGQRLECLTFYAIRSVFRRRPALWIVMCRAGVR